VAYTLHIDSAAYTCTDDTCTDPGLATLTLDDGIAVEESGIYTYTHSAMISGTMTPAE
jgi:hypothetical protein